MRSNRLLTRSAFVAALAVGGFSGTAAEATSVTLDFENLQHGGGGPVFHPSPILEDGFRIIGNQVGNDFLVEGTASPLFPGSTALGLFGNETFTLSATDGSPFSLISMLVSEQVPNNQSTTTTFTGHLLAGGTVSQDVTTNGAFGFEAVNFSGFTNLTHVTFTTALFNIQLDNIVLASIPEPATALCGLMGLSLLATRRRRTA